jgi:ABC-2 type transport system permease protein
MRQALTLALLHLKMTFKSRSQLVTMFALPLVLTLVIGMMLSGQGSSQTAKGHRYPVAVVDLDGSYLSGLLVDQLRREETLNVKTAAEADLSKQFADRQIETGIVIPKGFAAGVVAGAAPEVKLINAPGGSYDLGVGPIIRRTTAQIAQDYRLAVQAAGTGADAAKIQQAYDTVVADRQKLSATTAFHTVAKAQSGDGTVDAKTQLSSAAVGFIVTFVLMLVFMMGGVILQERQRGTWGRLLTAPVSKLSLIGGYVLSFFLTGMAQFAILVIATRILFQIEWGPLLPLIAMAAVTVLCGGGMGLFLAGIVRTPEQQATVGILFINATSMLGGVYWDLSVVSKTMQRIGYLTPQAWAIDGFREVMFRGAQWSHLFLPMAVLLGITVVFMTAGLLRVRYE